MAVWMEIRCDYRSEHKIIFPDEPCWSDENNGPMEMAGNTQQSAIRNHRFLARDAKKAGWAFKNGEWICPTCWARIQAGKEALHTDI
ncbi:MAG TPA: hypothetical protein VK558_07775 [Patescibacteria group bacterium]|nr:hypothetical protein [Patescibacteria group bacterium]